MSIREQDVLRRAGEASVLVLVSLADEPKHGYALIQDVKQFASVELGPGTLYDALDRLERLGLIESLPAGQVRQTAGQVTVTAGRRPPARPGPDLAHDHGLSTGLIR